MNTYTITTGNHAEHSKSQLILEPCEHLILEVMSSKLTDMCSEIPKNNPQYRGSFGRFSTLSSTHAPKMLSIHITKLKYYCGYKSRIVLPNLAKVFDILHLQATKHFPGWKDSIIISLSEILCEISYYHKVLPQTIILLLVRSKKKCRTPLRSWALSNLWLLQRSMLIIWIVWTLAYHVFGRYNIMCTTV